VRQEQLATVVVSFVCSAVLVYPCFIMVPTSELTSPKGAFASKPDTVWVPPAPTGRATCLTIFFLAPHANTGRITTDIGHFSSFSNQLGILGCEMERPFGLLHTIRK
jgi:hypothetical protein